ncbi:ATPase domain-containing protein [Merismopedia glauca]|uniref:non-specific serine/threonine protein kinase n=1 Tax=Merismopedia glauca CCAP 1448/3 TaxID=1296344 RepID=A0A2T1CAM8_9CYAN|nr:ATPase domain-containing protein [Merismopedia glauca]PSB05301.1 recombinase RecA [Merismopedia glauca CCAP 1448/3]
MLQKREKTGIYGLDELLEGGLIANRAYLIRGGPGCGKTTLGLHFLATGSSQGEPGLFITLSEAAAQIQSHAEALELDLNHITFLDLSPSSEFFTEVQTYDIFSPAEVEREPTTRRIIEQVELLKPKRIFIDAMTQFRYLATDTFQYRKQVLSFIRFLLDGGATVLFTSESSVEAPDDDLQFISDGVIQVVFSSQGRSIAITKFRGSGFQSGDHSLHLSSKGMEVYPRLKPGEHRREFVLEAIPSGIPELDTLMHGGIERGTVTIISGPSGVGKTTVGLQFMKEAAGRGERSVVYTFEEEAEILLSRCESINIPARTMVERGTLSVVKVEPLQYTPDRFARMVREEAEVNNAQIVMIDSVAGYRLSLNGEDLVPHIHALCKYLANMGVTVLLINEVGTVASEFRATDVGITYLADNFVFLRYWERQINGVTEIRKAIGVLKKRLSDFEKNLRELQITRYGIKVGEPMPGLQGILSATPWFTKAEGQ